MNIIVRKAEQTGFVVEEFHEKSGYMSKTLGAFSTAEDLLFWLHEKLVPEPVAAETPAATTNDGWIEWKGGECPVDSGTVVVVRLKDGSETERGPMGLRWHHVPDDDSRAAFNIVAYRVV